MKVLAANEVETRNFYKARTPQRTTIITRVDTSMLEIEAMPIPVDGYRPAFSDELTIAPNLMLEDCWEKHPTRIGEILMGHPHPNVATYHGCILRGGCIRSLCFTRYHQNLVERIYHDTRTFSRQDCLQEIKRGIQHLHSLGIVHNDINPSNVMLTMDDTAVIIDFNSCCKEGEEGHMGSTFQWTDGSYNNNCAEFENDMCGLRKINEWLHDPAPFHWNGLEDRTRHEQQGHHGQLGEECFICR